MKVFTYIKNDSNRVKRKNFRSLDPAKNKHPLWKNLIYELKEFDTYIDTDSKQVIRDCKKDFKNVTAYPRDQKFIDLENDPNNKASPALLMVDNFLDRYVENENECIVLTHVTSPFLTAETVKDAASYIGEYDFVHSIHSIQDFAWIGDSFKPVNFDPSYVQRTQDVEKIHFSSGAFFIFTKKSFKKYNNRIGPNTFYYPLNHVEAIEIDTEDDLEFAQIVLRGIYA